MEAKHTCTYLHVFIDLYAIYRAVNFQQGIYGYIKIQGLLFEKKKKKGKLIKYEKYNSLKEFWRKT